MDWQSAEQFLLSLTSVAQQVDRILGHIKIPVAKFPARQTRVDRFAFPSRIDGIKAVYCLPSQVATWVSSTADSYFHST